MEGVKKRKKKMMGIDNVPDIYNDGDQLALLVCLPIRWIEFIICKIISRLTRIVLSKLCCLSHLDFLAKCRGGMVQRLYHTI